MGPLYKLLDNGDFERSIVLGKNNEMYTTEKVMQTGLITTYLQANSNKCDITYKMAFSYHKICKLRSAILKSLVY